MGSSLCVLHRSCAKCHTYNGRLGSVDDLSVDDLFVDDPYDLSVDDPSVDDLSARRVQGSINILTNSPLTSAPTSFLGKILDFCVGVFLQCSLRVLLHREAGVGKGAGLLLRVTLRMKDSFVLFDT